MAIPALVVSFDARGLIMGDATARAPGMVVRHLLRRGDLRDDTLTLLFEIDHGASVLDAIVAGVRERYGADVEVLWDDPAHWRARVTYCDLSTIRDHPVYGAIFLIQPLVVRAVLHFEEGLSIQRYDLTEVPTDAAALLQRIRDRAAAHDIACMARITELDMDLLHWSPLDDPANRP